MYCTYMPFHKKIYIMQSPSAVAKALNQWYGVVGDTTMGVLQKNCTLRTPMIQFSYTFRTL